MVPSLRNGVQTHRSGGSGGEEFLGELPSHGPLSDPSCRSRPSYRGSPRLDGELGIETWQSSWETYNEP